MLNSNKDKVAMTLSLLMIVVFNYVVSAQNSPSDLQPHNQHGFRDSNNPRLSRAKRMYALCPPDFQKIGNDCFFLSKRKESWLDSHFECKDRNSKLAEPLKFADRRLRKYLQNKAGQQGEKWIGGMYNYQQKKWKWGYNGGEMKYQAFDDAMDSSDLKFHCTAMDPAVEYRWNAKGCIERHYFICQHRMSFVNEKNRQKVYSKWNETYPNQIANEVEIYVSTNGNRSNYYRKKPRIGTNRLTQLNNDIQKLNQVASSSSSTTALPEYLPYNAYKNIENTVQKRQEDFHHSLQPLVAAAQTDQQSLKQRKRHSFKLSGNVDLGTNMFKNKRQRQAKVVTNESSQNVRHHPHNHRHINNALPEVETRHVDEKTTIERQIETTRPKTTPAPTLTTTSTVAPAIIEATTLSELKKKLEEKAHRRERLKAKLALLTPEERQAFLLMKQQRAEARKKGFISSN